MLARVARRALQTRLVWLLMRLAVHERTPAWLARALPAPLRLLTARGDLSILGGIGVRALLDARSFDPGGAQSYGVLTGTHEVQVQQALVRTLRPGDRVWDVGANIGYLAIGAARLGAEVVAVEPDPGCAAAIRANAALNGLDAIEVVEAAAAGRSGKAELTVVADRLWTRLSSVGAHALAERRITVDTLALDDLDRPPPAVVKIDVEGGELEVLAGMSRLLAEQRPVVICEMHGRNAAFCAAMREAGYGVTNLDGPDPVEEAGENVHALCTPLIA